MKKYVFVVFAIIACLALTGCKSQAVRTAEKQINSIGDVTIESGPAISEAEKSYAALSSDEQGTVSNYQTLTDARDTYQSIALDSFQSAIEAGNYDEGNQIVSKLDDTTLKNIGYWIVLVRDRTRCSIRYLIIFFLSESFAAASGYKDSPPALRRSEKGNL